MPALRAGFERWRELGARRGTARALELAAGRARAPLRASLLRLRPVSASEAEVAAALADDPVEVLRGRVLAAVPTVARWERSFGDVLPRAADIRAHRFDLLGSGPVDLGRQIDWQRDFKAGRRWPLRHIAFVPIAYPDSSDIKVPWELTRFQHLPLLAAAARLDPAGPHLDEIGAQLDDWIARNPVEFGACWACTMDVAIRAANWIATLALVAEQARDRAWLARALASLLLHGRFIRSHLELSEVRGNHYLSDVVGLTAVAALFAGGAEGREWATFAAAELEAEMGHQVHPDGCDHEASIPYHRLVTELFVCGTQAIDALVPGALGATYRERLDRMLAFVADYTRPDGLAPQIGDADDGRYLPLGDYAAADPRAHMHLFRQADLQPPAPLAPAAYPDGGYYVMRCGDLYAIVRCGPTGMRGRGGHGHNDQLSFELCAGETPLVVDPGAFVYTADPAERVRFRSTAYHSTLALDGAEQNENRPDALFAMPDRSRAELLRWEPGARRTLFEGRHHGYEHLPEPAVHARTVVLDADARALTIDDAVESRGRHRLQWTFPLAPDAEAEVAGAGVRARVGDVMLEIAGAGVSWAVEDGWYSPGYGRRVPAAFVRGRRESEPRREVVRVTLTVR